MDKKQEAITLYKELKNSIEVGKRLDIPDRTIRYWVKKDNCSAVASIGMPQINISLCNGSIIAFGDNHQEPDKERSIAAQAVLLVSDLIKPQVIIGMGDTYDFASISKHDKLGYHHQYTVAEEIDLGMKYLTDIKKASPGAEHILLEGNHDTRFNKLLANKLPQFKGVKGFDIIDHIPAGWRYCMAISINENTIFLHSIHGGIHAAYNNTMKGGISVVTGHTHILEAKPMTDYSGTRFGVQTGTLATIRNNSLFAYTNGSPLNWQSGFAVLTYIEGELQYPEFCYINKKGNAVFRGKVIL